MQQAVPVISSEEGGIPDIISNGENGLIVKSKSAEELAMAIQRLFDSSALRKELGEKGYDKFRASYTLTQFEENILKNCLNLI